MIFLLQFQEWSKSDLCGAIWGSGEGRAFCAGGDVDGECRRVLLNAPKLKQRYIGVVRDAANPETRPKAIQFFKSESVYFYYQADHDSVPHVQV